MKNRLRKLSLKEDAARADCAPKHADTRGSALLTVVVVSAVAAVLLVAVMTAIISANAVSTQNFKAQQAYFTARSAVNAVVNYICSPSNAESLSALIPENVDDAPIISQGDSEDGLGWYQVSIKNVSDKNHKRIKITAVGYYPDKENGVSRTISRCLDYVSGSYIFDSLLYLNSTDTVNLGQCKLTGSIVTNNSLYFAQGTTINGNILSGGDVTISGGGQGISNVTAAGNINIDAGGTITNGNVCAGGDATITGGGTISGNLTANGSLTMKEGGRVLGNVVTGKDAFFDGGTQIYGNLLAGGKYHHPNYGAFVSGNIADNQPVEKVSISVPTSETKIISPPSQLSDPWLYSSVAFSSAKTAYNNTYSDAKISQDGTLDLSGYSFTYGANINIDASEDDINLLIDKDTTLPGGLSLYVYGSHNLYIWLENGASLYATAQNIISASELENEKDKDGNKKPEAPRIFIIGGDKSSLYINNTYIKACVYLPTGTITLDGTSSFEGSAVADNIDADHNVTLNYAKPKIDGTVLDRALSSWTPGDWSEGGWSDK